MNEPAGQMRYDSTGLRLSHIHGWTCVQYRDGVEVSGYNIGWWG